VAGRLVHRIGTGQGPAGVRGQVHPVGGVAAEQLPPVVHVAKARAPRGPVQRQILVAAEQGTVQPGDLIGRASRPLVPQERPDEELAYRHSAATPNDGAATQAALGVHQPRRCRHNWVVKYRVDGRQRKKSFPWDGKAVANNFKARVDHEGGTGDLIDPKAGEISFTVYAEKWIAQHPGSPRTRALYESVLRNHISPAIGDTPLRRITREQARDLLLETMPKTVGASVVNTARTLISAVLSEAARSERILSNPATGMRLPPGRSAAEFTSPTRKQLDVLAAGMRPDWSLTIWLMRGCELRIGEACRALFAAASVPLREAGRPEGRSPAAPPQARPPVGPVYPQRLRPAQGSAVCGQDWRRRGQVVA
jgi:Phage integrase, N-terminal SAM-like domain